ncbi:hypothetical protein K439DRAFT_1615912 [Ramaria rubella]|nr:hypothetical protein K439DRAFT_1615912 [Ramaria rubella]
MASWDAIPPFIFYSNPSTTAPAIPQPPVIPELPVIPDAPVIPPQPSKPLAPRKTCEEFTFSDIKKLLNGVLHVDPFMCKCAQMKEKWQEVLQVVQSNGRCLGRDWETIHNKLKVLLKMVGVCVHLSTSLDL